MSTWTIVHHIGGSLDGESNVYSPYEIIKVKDTYKLYPTYAERQMYGIPYFWMVERFGYVDTAPSDIVTSNLDIVNFMIERANILITKTAIEKGAILMPLTRKEEIEDIPLMEDLIVKTVSVSMLTTVPS